VRKPLTCPAGILSPRGEEEVTISDQGKVKGYNFVNCCIILFIIDFNIK
jgi:hypothetical protein